MSIDEAVPLFFRMVFAFLAAFLAVALWSKARDAAWVCIVMGALLAFVDAVYAVLVLLGLASYSLPVFPGFPLLKSALGALPSVFLAIGFLIFLIRSNWY